MAYEKPVFDSPTIHNYRNPEKSIEDKYFGELFGIHSIRKSESKTYSDLLEDSNSNQLIKYTDIIEKYSALDLKNFAESYFSSLTNVDYLIAKPFYEQFGASSLIGNFASLIHGAELFDGISILDFGCGSGWTSRILAQMKCYVIAMDLSLEALKISNTMLKALPIIDDTRNNIQFSNFDGETIPLKNNSIERVICMDSFHHIVNQEKIISEFFRILKPGGMVIMSEPGPSHSLTEMAQFEMKNFNVIERDIIVEDIQFQCMEIGFSKVEVGIYNPIPTFYEVDIFKSLIESDAQTIAQLTKNYMTNHRLIRLIKQGNLELDSRQSRHNKCEIKAHLKGTEIIIHLRNIGKSKWLKSGTKIGSVNVVINVLDHKENTVKSEICYALNNDLCPGEEMTIHHTLNLDLVENFKLKIDLVSNNVSYFSSFNNITSTIILSEERKDNK